MQLRRKRQKRAGGADEQRNRQRADEQERAGASLRKMGFDEKKTS